MITAQFTQLFATSTSHIIISRLHSSWPWYIIRGAGFAAAGLLILLMLSGIGQVTGLSYRLFEPVKAWMIHKALAIALCFAIVIHATFLLFDHYVSFSLAQILVPFSSHYTNGIRLFGWSFGGLAVTLGIVSTYLVAIIVASSLGWIDRKKTTWRWLHYLSYLAMLFVFVHALTDGTDLKYGVFRLFWMLLILLIFIASIVRLTRVGTLRK